MEAVKKRVVVGPGGTIELRDPALPEGATAEVIVMVEPQVADRSLVQMIGTGRGGFATPQEADRFIRGERDTWAS